MPIEQMDQVVLSQGKYQGVPIAAVPAFHLAFVLRSFARSVSAHELDSIREELRRRAAEKRRAD